MAAITDAQFEKITAEAKAAAIAATESYIFHNGEPSSCGFAWVRIDGRGSFATKAKAAGIADSGHPKGLDIWACSDVVGFKAAMTQSMAVKEVAMRAYAKVLTDNGIKAHVQSRAD
jgi:hypothetical protein